MASEQAEVYGDAFQALTAGKSPADPDVTAVAERHRQVVERWF